MAFAWLILFLGKTQAIATIQATADCEANPGALPGVLATLRANRNPGTTAELYIKGLLPQNKKQTYLRRQMP